MIDINESSLKQGLLGILVFLVELIRDVLRTQALRRIELGHLTDAEIARLGEAFMELDEAINQIKMENGLDECVQQVREGLDDLVDDFLEKLVNPERWAESAAV
ncbi:MAG: gas vesicle protein K [Bacillota bacterium]|nr:gas vesicle protein K [Bacillota bacterium]